MATTNPPVFNTAGTHPAQNVRRMFASLTKDDEGVAAASEMAVTEKATANMSVDISAGRAWIKGTEDSFQGTYFVESQSVTNVAVTASDATNPRIDLVVAMVEDTDYSTVTDVWTLEVVAGTPASSPSAPSQPASSLLLATVEVAALATTIVTANITQSTPVLSSGTITLAGDATGSGAINFSTGDATVTAVVADDSHSHGTSTVAALDAGDTTTGTFGAARIPNLDGSKITSGTVAAARIDNISGAKITSGTVAAAYVDNLSGAKITSGLVSYNYISDFPGSKITSGTVAAAYMDDISGAKVTSGTVADARIASTITRDTEAAAAYYAGSAGGTGRKITPSTSAPSGGSAGDIWLKY